MEIDKQEQERLDSEHITQSSTPQARVKRWLSRTDIEEEFESEKGKKELSYSKLVLSYMKKNKIWTFLLITSVIIFAMSSATSPILMQQTLLAAKSSLSIPITVEEGYWGIKLWIVITVQIVALIAMAFSMFVSQWTAGMLGKKIEVDLRNDLNKKLISMDMSYYSDKKIGEILTKVISDTQIIGEQTGIIPVTFLNGILVTIAAISVMFFIDVWMTLILILIFVSLGIIFAILFFPIKPKAYAARKVVTEVNGDVTDRISNVKLIKASGTARYEEARFIEKHKAYYEKGSALNFYQSTIITLLYITINAIESSMIVACVILYRDHPEKIISVLVGMVPASSLMIGPMMSLLRILVGLTQSNVASKRVGEILNQTPRFNNHFDDEEGIIISDIKGNIVFKDVAFAYPEKPTELILPKFDFVFENGKSYAFVGGTGSGKSTIARLLLRFYDPTIGMVIINDDINLKDVKLSSYLDLVGYVEQEPAIFLGDVYDNVRYGRFNATNKDIIKACKKAELHDLIMSWPDGYDTILGERGFMLSGGQKQRLVIARMFLKNPKILILDEATSALDNIVEEEIQAKLNELMKGRTSVTIAHRLSTIKNVDEILVLAPKEGIVQRGTFNELKKIDGHFKNLYDAGNSKKDRKGVEINE
ncbi:ABC transporter ATP-binding protein [Mesoplasma corruscae]|uniref:ABC transporter ATP-binding protein n=1 Tax=Mesoplasma corruscae TaxID=216874 RepID=A0A2S5RHK0_9MOLU|nr:ABC transporter ATP-binding protein [Mesoplasma corruscae]PPE06806.1 ABC transporter ATP-binding protein [Mesoplasma corruscae]